MKFQFAFAALIALAAAQESTPSTTTTASLPPAPTAEDRVVKCIKDNNCGTDVNCQAKCVGSVLPETPQGKCVKDNNCGENIDCVAKCYGVPNPDAQQINGTTTCVAACDQSDAKVFAECRDACIATKFFQYPNATNVKPPSTDSKDGNKATPTSGSGNKTSNAYQLVPALTSTAIGLGFLILSL